MTNHRYSGGERSRTDSQRPQVFGPASATLALHPIALSTPSSADVLVDGVLAQARAAEESGFDGATVSEHHRGLPAYMPQPLLISNWVLAETSHIWSGPNPTLLTLRNASLFAEEIAWTAVRYPGRVGATVAPGYNPDDFAAAGLSAENIAATFSEKMQGLVAALSPEGPLEGDQAVDSWIRNPAPFAAAANSTAAVLRAARAGMGVSLVGSDSVSARAIRILGEYREAGGRGPVMWTRRGFIGTPPAKAIEALEKIYSTSPKANGSQGDFVTGEPESIAETLVSELDLLGPDSSLVLHLNLPDVELPEALEQVIRFGEEVLPLLKKERKIAS